MWTPEFLMAIKGFSVTIVVLAITAVMNKYTLKLPVRRNSNNQFSGMSISDFDNRCQDLHALIDTRLLDIDKTNSQQEESLRQVEMRLNKGEDKFETIIEKLSGLNADIKTEAAKSEFRERDMERTINLASQTMREFLQKTG